MKRVIFIFRKSDSFGCTNAKCARSLYMICFLFNENNANKSFIPCVGLVRLTYKINFKAPIPAVVDFNSQNKKNKSR